MLFHVILYIEHYSLLSLIPGFANIFFHLSDQLHEGPEKMKVDRVVQNYCSQFVTENSISYIL